MNIILACKAFFKALFNPKETQRFLTNKKESNEERGDPSHLRLLALLQQNSRLIDFLKEDITEFEDAQIGAAVRQIHRDCAKTLEEIISIRPVREENEGAKISVPKGYDPSQIKLLGKVSGEPPYVGILVHKGWQAHKRSLPKQTSESSNLILCPAEIEIQ